MGDIRTAGDFVLQGRVTINELPQDRDLPFEHMTLEDLCANLEYHRELANDERRRINALSLKFLGVSVVAAIALTVWYFVAGKVELAMFLLGLSGIGAPALFAKITRGTPSEFELRQLNTVRLLSYLIRERSSR